MNLSFLVGAAVGYVLGAKAGRERYEAILRSARKVADSQTVQSTAGVLHAQVDDLRARAKQAVGSKLHASDQPAPAKSNGAGDYGV